MKTMFAVFAFAVASSAAGNEFPSVVNHNQPTVVQSGTSAAVRGNCANGQCRLFSTEERSREYSRHRLFGGQVLRRSSRVVVRPVR